MSQKKFRITQADFMLANRKAARDEEIREHGRQISFRSVKQKSKKAYDRNRLKRTGIGNDDLSFLLTELHHGFFLSTGRLTELLHGFFLSTGRQQEKRRFASTDGQREVFLHT